MLKIKDNVDLKELEKYGFKKDCYYRDSDVPTYRKVAYGDGKYAYLKIDIFFDGEILIRGTLPPVYIDDLDVIFDLIQAGLVEKVEE